MPLALLADRAFHAIDENTSLYDAVVAHGVPLPIRPADLVSIVDRHEDDSPASTLRSEANRLFERLGATIAHRLAELQASAARGEGIATDDRVSSVADVKAAKSRSARVELLPQ